jgi:hypothetical protein
MRFTYFIKCAAILLFLSSCSNSSSQNVSQSSPANPSSSLVTPEAPTKQVDSFADGVNKATNAAKLAQTAKSSGEWSQVAAEWQSAINFMQSVSSSGSNYKVAKQRQETYQRKLAYAQKNANRLQQEQVKMQKTQIVRGEKVFTSLKGIYQAAGAATATPVVRVVIPQTGWQELSKSDQISLTMYAESLISVVKSDPSKYISIPSSAPIYNTFENKIANLCQDCWSIIMSYKDSQPYGIDETIVQGDTPWMSDDPCCRGIKSSEFRK